MITIYWKQHTFRTSLLLHPVLKSISEKMDTFTIPSRFVCKVGDTDVPQLILLKYAFLTINYMLVFFFTSEMKTEPTSVLV